jgi:hypothetical protein
MVGAQVSAPIKVFALVGVLAALVLGGGMMLMGRGTSDEATAPIVIPSKKAGLLEAPAAAKKVAAKASTSAKNAGKVTPAAKAKPAAKPKPAVKPKPAAKTPARLIAANGLPSRLVSQLQANDVVIVALWGSGGKIDAMSRDEAAAGASAARAGFVSIDVIKNSREAEALTLKLGFVLRAPGVLVFKSPDTLSNTLDGFRDRETVAQAALDALR